MISNTSIVQSYFRAIVEHNLDALPVAEDVTFIDPMLPDGRVNGRAAFTTYLASVLPYVDDVSIRRLIEQDEVVVVIWDLRMSDVSVSICETFEVQAGVIVHIEAYFDPRPLAVLSTPGAENRAHDDE